MITRGNSLFYFLIKINIWKSEIKRKVRPDVVIKHNINSTVCLGSIFLPIFCFMQVGKLFGPVVR